MTRPKGLDRDIRTAEEQRWQLGGEHQSDRPSVAPPTNRSSRQDEAEGLRGCAQSRLSSDHDLFSEFLAARLPPTPLPRRRDDHSNSLLAFVNAELYDGYWRLYHAVFHLQKVNERKAEDEPAGSGSRPLDSELGGSLVGTAKCCSRIRRPFSFMT